MTQLFCVSSELTAFGSPTVKVKADSLELALVDTSPHKKKATRYDCTFARLARGADRSALINWLETFPASNKLIFLFKVILRTVGWLIDGVTPFRWSIASLVIETWARKSDRGRNRRFIMQRTISSDLHLNRQFTWWKLIFLTSSERSDRGEIRHDVPLQQSVI